MNSVTHSTNKKYIVFFLSLSFFVALVIYKTLFTEPSSNSHDTNQEKIYTYEHIEKKYISLVQNKNPSIALDTLTIELSDTSEYGDKLSKDCHRLVHKLGRAAYNKYSDFSVALQYQNELCNSGYIHGVIEERFTSIDDLTKELTSLCASQTANKLLYWQCYHGIGHGLMYFTNNNVPTALDYCDSLTDESETTSCLNGVFMENFLVDQQRHTSKYVSNENPIFPCPELDEKHKEYCYLYAPTFYLHLHKENYVEALTWCERQDSKFQYACAIGVGSQTVEENINNPKIAETACTLENSRLSTFCLQGIVGLYIKHFASIEKAALLCDSFELNNQKLCKDTISSQRFLFN